MLQRTAAWAAWFTCAALVAPAQAEDSPLMAAIFADHVVLQRDRPIEVWGRAQPGEQVTVTMSGANAQRGQRRRGTLVGGIALVPGGWTVSAQRAYQHAASSR